MADVLTSPLRVERHEGTWDVRIDRPHAANALSAGLVEGLLAVVDEAGRCGVEVLVLRGSRRHFAAGLDLTGLDEETDASLALRLLRIGLLLDALATAPYLTVAVVEGHAVGAGADLALACDHRVGTAAARFRFPGSRFGVVLGTARLAAVAGPDVALTLASGSTADALLAHAHGLLTDLTDDPDAAVAALTRSWAAVHPGARPGLLGQSRPPVVPAGRDPVAALARSVAVPGLRDRVAAYVSTPTQEDQ